MYLEGPVIDLTRESQEDDVRIVRVVPPVVPAYIDEEDSRSYYSDSDDYSHSSEYTIGSWMTASGMLC